MEVAPQALLLPLGPTDALLIRLAGATLLPMAVSLRMLKVRDETMFLLVWVRCYSLL